MLSNEASQETTLAFEDGLGNAFVCSLNDDGCATIERCEASGVEIHVPSSIGGHPVVAVGDESFASAVKLAQSNAAGPVVRPGKCGNVSAMLGGPRVAACSPSPDVLNEQVIQGYLNARQRSGGVNAQLQRVILPDGVVSVGRAAFRGCAKLVEVVLPDSLESIDDLAFSMTAVREMRIPRRCTQLAENALRTGPEVVPGADISYRSSVRRVSVDDGNPLFCMHGSVLCRRLHADALEAIFCPGEVDVVDLSDGSVGAIASSAFAGVAHIGELRIRESLAYDTVSGLLPNGTCDVFSIVFDAPREGFEGVSVRIAERLQARRLFDATRGSKAIDVVSFLDRYDTSLYDVEDRLLQAQLMLDRLARPVLLGDGARLRFTAALERSLDSLCAHFGARGQWERFDLMADAGLLHAENMLPVLEVLNRMGDAASVAYLLQFQRARGWRAEWAAIDMPTEMPPDPLNGPEGTYPSGPRENISSGAEREVAPAIGARGTAAEPLSPLERATDLATDIVHEARTVLMASLRFMDVALWRMPLATKNIGSAMATDGYLFYLDPVRVVRSYRCSEAEIARDYLHAILHCVFRHPFDDGHPNRALWDLACDVAVESCAMELVGLRFPCEGDPVRRRALETLKRSCPQLTAAKLYNMLADALEGNSGETHASGCGLAPSFVKSLPGLFARDDHAVWQRSAERPAAQMTFDDDVAIIGSGDERLAGERETELDDGQSPSKPGMNMPGAPAPSAGGAAAEGEVEGGDRFIDADPGEEGEAAFASMRGVRVDDFDYLTWTDISKLVQLDMQAYTGKPGVDAGTFEVNLHVERRNTCDFRTFLRRFSALSEEMKVSTEEFDYVYYTYGLSRYGNMPLVEPLEYQETRRIRDFVVAIDTSASCAGGLVRHFVEKTYDVLRSEASFGRKVNVHVVQCDCDVRKDTKITSVRDLDGEFGEFTARGFGGTDFRPVFKYVDDLIASRELTNLKGLIYLTDGIGTFPKEAPDYDCAFVFVNDEGADRPVPSWASKVLMTEDQIMEL